MSEGPDLPFHVHPLSAAPRPKPDDLQPYRALFAAMIASGVRDATAPLVPKSVKVDARSFLRSRWAEGCARFLGVPLDQYRRRVKSFCAGYRPEALSVRGPVCTHGKAAPKRMRRRAA
jgi:hypothetical protein